MTAAGGRYSCIMVTLTYRPGVEWSPNHVRTYINANREWFRRRHIDARYQWVAELTQAGVMHYHVLIWGPHGFRVPMADKRGWWPHGHTKTERARKAVGYMVKYASKAQSCDGQFPKGARIYGMGGGEGDERLASHRAGLPTWLREATQGRVSRVTGVGWVERDTGEVYRSPFRICWGSTADGRLWMEVRSARDA